MFRYIADNSIESHERKKNTSRTDFQVESFLFIFLFFFSIFTIKYINEISKNCFRNNNY